MINYYCHNPISRICFWWYALCARYELRLLPAIIQQSPADENSSGRNLRRNLWTKTLQADVSGKCSSIKVFWHFRPTDSASKRWSVLASDSRQPYAGEWTKWVFSLSLLSYYKYTSLHSLLCQGYKPINATANGKTHSDLIRILYVWIIIEIMKAKIF